MTKRVLGLLAFAACLVAARGARADAAQDVRDIRAGRLPVRHQWLGWDAAGHAHVRELVCSDGGTVSCRAAFLELEPRGKGKRTALLDVNEVYCGNGSSCAALDKKTVGAFEAAEKRALAALPSATPTPPLADPKGVLGAVAGEPTRVEVAAFDVSKSPDDVPHLAVRLVARGKGGAFEVLATLDERVFTLDKSKLEAAYASPDGKSAVVVATTETSVMCWSFQSLESVLVDLPQRRASLANTIGFRAWKKGDMPSALAAFTESTQHDASYALGWYNRAAVESRTGGAVAAAASFKKAVGLDPKLAARACKDRDFDAMRAADPSLVSCR